MLTYRAQNYLLLICILLLAWLLRIAWLDFGAPQPSYNESLSPLLPTWSYIHPDEYFYVAIPAQMEHEGRWNPNFFENPSFLINLNLVNMLLTNTSSSEALNRVDIDTVTLRNFATFPMYFVGRVFSALGGMLVVPAVFTAARKLYGLHAGLASALLATVVFPLVHHAHYATTSSLATGFVAVSLLACVLALGAPHAQVRWWLIVAAFSAGLATSNRYNAGIAIILLGLTNLYLVSRFRDRTSFVTLIMSGSICVLTLLITSPFLLLDIQTFWMQFSSITQSYKAAPSTIERAVFHIYRYMSLTILGGVGVPLACAGFMRLLFDERYRIFAVMSTVCIVLYTIIALDNQRTQISEQLTLIIVPFFIVFAGIGIAWLRAHGGRIVGASALFATLIIPTIMSVQFNALLLQMDTRNKMQTWVYENIPQGTTVLMVGSYNIGLDPANYDPIYRYGLNTVTSSDLEAADYVVLSDANLFLQQMFGLPASMPALLQASLPDYPVAYIPRPRWLFHDLPVNNAAYWHNPSLKVYRIGD